MFEYRITRLEIRDIRKEKKNLCPSRWTTASAAKAREAVPGVKRFVFLSLKVVPLVQKDSRTIVKFLRTNKVRNEYKGQCCFNSDCGNVNNYKLTTNR